jgi:transposase InsO family protein
MTEYELVTSLRDTDGFEVREICETLAVSRSGYYAAKKRQPSPRAQENACLAAEMRKIHGDQQLKSYGSPRMVEELHDRGYRASENRVARIMRNEGLRAHQKRAFRPKTTVQDSDSAHRIAPNRLADYGKPTAPGEALATDITYVATREGWLYLAVVIDLFSRCVIGWSVSENLTTALAIRALRRAINNGAIRLAPGCIFHSDRGCQYTSHQHLEEVVSHGLVASMSASGYCYDNASCESFFATLKTEAFPDDQVFGCRREASLAIFEYIETFYNRRRKHSSLGYKSPEQFLALHALSMN